jgi:uncharacterized membrane protein YphA (DoxX/SURF4 family)
VTLVRVALAAVLGVAGVAKLGDRAGSRTALVDFGLPPQSVGAVASVLPIVELGAAAALLWPVTAPWGGVVALGLFTTFVTLIAANLARGRTPDCHCFGQLHSAPAGWTTLVRNVVLAAAAGFVVIGGWAN